MSNIFITGGTGFLGWELVKELLKGDDPKLYLLSRGKTKQSARERVFSLIRKDYKGGERKKIFTRIEVIGGDITGKNFGINKSRLEKLYKKIDMIYHCAALCEFGIPLRNIRKINVFGTKNVLDFALKCKKKGCFSSFHYISTVAVMGKSGGIFYEDALDVNQEFNNTYEQTKFEAEKSIEEYRDRGLNISVYRPSVITGNSVTGETSNFQIFYQPLHIFSLEIFREIPANSDLSYSLVPVDYVAKAIFLISFTGRNNKNYHLTNPHTTTLNFVLDIASSYFGFRKPMLVPEQEFDFRKMRGYRKRLLCPYIPYLIHKEMVFDTTNFKQAIEGKSFSWPVIDRKLLLRIFKYCADVKYIKRCRHR